MLPWIITHTTWCTSEPRSNVARSRLPLHWPANLPLPAAQYRIDATEPDKSPEESWPGSSTCNMLASRPERKKHFWGGEQAIVVPRGTAQHSTERQSMTPYRLLRGAHPSFQRQCNFVRAQTQEKHTLVCVGAEGGHSLRSFERCRLLASCMLTSGPIVTLSLLFASWAHALESDLHSADVCVRIYIQIRES